MIYYKVVNTLLLIINFMMCLTLQHYYKRLEINNGYNYSTSSSMKVIVSQKVAKKAKIFDHLPKMSTFFLRNQSKKARWSKK